MIFFLPNQKKDSKGPKGLLVRNKSAVYGAMAWCISSWESTRNESGYSGHHVFVLDRNASVRWIKSTRFLHPTPKVILNTPLHKKNIKRSQTCVTPLLNHGFWGCFCFSMFRIRTKGLTVDHSPIQSHWWPFRGAIPGLGTGSKTILSNFLSA